VLTVDTSVLARSEQEAADTSADRY
jgi:hypothetical protein